jgi:hypothetical protein
LSLITSVPGIENPVCASALDGNRGYLVLTVDLSPMPDLKVLSLNVLSIGRAVVCRHLSIYMTSTLLDGIEKQIPSPASHLKHRCYNIITDSFVAVKASPDSDLVPARQALKPVTSPK